MVTLLYRAITLSPHHMHKQITDPFILFVFFVHQQQYITIPETQRG
jgi:hypothetical protein